MTASLRGLALCTLALALAALWWMLGGAPALPSPRLWSGSAEGLRELRWQRAGAPEVVLARRDGAWQVQAPVPGPAEERRVDELLAALAGARWHRRAEVARAGALGVRLWLDGEVLALGQELGEQQWVVWRGRAWLVDRWVARLLESPEPLRDRALFPEATGAPILELHGEWGELVVQGASEVSPRRRRLEPSRLRAVRAQLAALEVAPDRRPGALGPMRWSVRLAGGRRGEATLQGGGACPGLPPATAAVSSRLGEVCLGDEALRALTTAIAGAVAAEALDPRPLAAAASEVVRLRVAAPGAPPSLVLVRDGGRWRAEQVDGAPPRAGGAPVVKAEGTPELTPDMTPELTDVPVDAQAVARALEELAEPWQVAEPSSAPPLIELVAGHADGSEVVLAWGRGRDHVWARRGQEPLALVRRDGADLRLPGWLDELIDRTLWRVEPRAVQALVIDGLRVRRGGVLGEWIDADGARLPEASAVLLEALLDELAAPRALRAAAPAAGLVVELELEDPPARAAASAPLVHRLEVAQKAQRCLAEVPPGSRAGLELAPGVCARASAAARALRR